MALMATLHCTPANPPSASAPAPMPAQASSTGSIQGQARVVGTLSLPPVKTNSSAERQCGTEISDRTVVIDPSGSLQYAVAFVDEPELPAGSLALPSDETLHVDQKQCSYEPPVLAARIGTTLEILNSDSLLHNVRAEEAQRTLFNSAMPLTGMKVRRRLPDAPGEIVLRCDVHPWMRSVVWTFAHPYFALTDAAGKYRIDAVPAGKHRLTLRHQRFPDQTFEIEVPRAGTAAQDVAWPASQLRERSFVR